MQAEQAWCFKELTSKMIKTFGRCPPLQACEIHLVVDTFGIAGTARKAVKVLLVICHLGPRRKTCLG